jgi:small subunit ribosomal protein S20
MPNIKSAKKRVITNAKKRDNNILTKSSMKTAIKKSEKAIKSGDKAQADETLKVALKRIDKAQSKGLIKKNAAARQKSRLTKKTNAVK